MNESKLMFYALEAPAPYGSRQGGHVIIFMAILLQGGPRITHPKNGCNQFSHFCGTWEQTDGQTVNYSKIAQPIS